jgi:hypothetical protein
MFLLWKGSKYGMFWVRVWSRSYPACNARAPYYNVICGLSGLNHIFPHYVIIVNDFWKNVIEHKACVLIFSTTFVWNISHSKKNWARYYIHRCTRLHVKYPLFFSDFNKTWSFRHIFKNTWILNFAKIRPVNAELFHADGQADGRTDGHTRHD